jgi:hypothetical protein
VQRPFQGIPNGKAAGPHLGTQNWLLNVLEGSVLPRAKRRDVGHNCRSQSPKRMAASIGVAAIPIRKQSTDRSSGASQPAAEE